MIEKDDSFQALILSILVHIAVALLLALFARSPEPYRNNSVEIEILDNREKSKSFVTDVDSLKLEEKLKEQADFLSRLNKRVKEQMVARRSGQTQNAGGSPNPPGQPKRQSLEGFKPAPDSATGFSGSQSATRNVVIGEAAIGEYIPGVKEGAFTALNTDQFLYYSFFSRINEQVRSRWVSRVRAFSSRQSPLNVRELARMQRITEIDVQLDKQGRFKRALVLRTSGYPELDETAVDAFRAAAPFQNPPQEMLESDDLIHLYYSFVVNWSPYQFAGRE